MIHPNCSLTDIGIHLKSIYGENNGRRFAPLEMASRIGRNISRIMKAERMGQLDVIPVLIPGVLAWSLAFADRMSIDADRALLVRLEEVRAVQGWKHVGYPAPVGLVARAARPLEQCFLP